MAGIIIPGKKVSTGPTDEKSAEAAPATGPCCPKCKAKNFTGRNIGGTVLFKCHEKGCGGEWSGGMGMFNPAGVKPPPLHDPYIPDLKVNLERKDPNHPGMFEEIRKPTDMRPDFKKGAPVPTNEDEEL